MNEWDIIQEICKGNPLPYQQLVERYKQRVFTTAMGFVHQKEEAEDLTQEVFIKAYQALPQFRAQALFSTWIYRITVNCCLNRTKKHRLSLFPLELGRHVQTSQQENPSDQMEKDELSRQLENALNRLPDNQRTAIILSKYDSLPQKEIARIMQLSEGSVEQLLLRAKKRLQKSLSCWE